MNELFGPIEFWHWWIAGVALAAVEMAAPILVFLWLGIAAGVTGLVLFFAPGISMEIQLLIFAVASVVSVVGQRAYLRRHPIESDDPTLNRRADRYIGRTFPLENAIEHGRGKVRVADTLWKVMGEDMAAGVTVRVTGVDGVTLKVERADTQALDQAAPAGADTG